MIREELIQHERYSMTKEKLIEFEDQVASLFNQGKIRAPVHLYSGNEDEMIKIFSGIRHKDWVFCSWRSHYQCLLKGVPKEYLLHEIIEGRSISLCFPEYKIYSSAIVGGNLPIALGTAMSIKDDAQVYCFIGDMTSESGMAHECVKYAVNHNLPIKFIIENNGKSVCTDTKDVWKYEQPFFKYGVWKNMFCKHLHYYEYETKYPHAGAGVRVQF